MRMWVAGPRVFGMRPGVSFNVTPQRRPRAVVAPPRAREFVYVVESSAKHVKIGITRHPERRLAELRTASAYPLRFSFVGQVHGSSAAVERQAHNLLSKHHLHGEWFSASPELAVAAVMSAADRLGVRVAAGASNPPPNAARQSNFDTWALGQVRRSDIQPALLRWLYRLAVMVAALLVYASAAVVAFGVFYMLLLIARASWS